MNKGNAMSNLNEEVFVTPNFLNQQIHLLMLLEARAERLNDKNLLAQIRRVKNNLIDIKVEQWYDAIDADEAFIQHALSQEGK